jgi:hypothetical protein
MACRRIDRLGVTRGRTIAAAVVGSAKMRAALEHLAGNLDVGGSRVEAIFLTSTAWVLRNAAGFRRIGVML